MKFNLIFSILLFCVGSSFAQILERGPYLQVNTSTSIIVRWDTDIPTNSKVMYGTDINNLNNTETLADTVVKHKVQLTGLDPNTKYYYSIGNDDEIYSAAGERQFFRTAPPTWSSQPLRVWAIGDFGKGNDGQRNVRDSYLNYLSDDKETDVWIWLGDNAYNDGTEAEYRDKVFDSINAYHHILKHTPFWPCPGNHDYNSVCPIPCGENPNAHSGAYYDIVSVPEQGEAGGVASSFPLYYSFDYSNVHFISLNSEIGSTTEAYDWNGVYDVEGWNNSPMKTWLEEDLEQNEKPWVVAYWHQVPFSKGSHDSDDFWELYMNAMRENVLPLLESYNVDIIITGHSHVYERSYLMNGFYGESSDFQASMHVVDGSSGNDDLGEAYVKNITRPNGNKGTVYVVCGNSGSRTSDPDLNHPIMHASHGGPDAYGSVIMEFDGDRVDVKYLKSDSTFGDQFTIIKEGVVGIDDLQETGSKVSQLKVFPHPFSDVANVYYGLDQQTDVTIELLDITGKKISTVFEGTLQAGPQNHYIYSSELGLTSGMYLVSVSDGNETQIQKIVKVD